WWMGGRDAKRAEDPKKVTGSSVAIGLKPRPRAVRSGGSANARVDAPLGPAVIESKVDHYEAEALAFIAARYPGSLPVKAPKKRRLELGSLFSWAGLFWSSAAGLVSLAFGLWLARLIEDLFSWYPVFGLIGLLLAGLAGTALLVLGMREASGFLRQRHISELHSGLSLAREKNDFDEARRLTRQLSALYSAKPEAA